MAKKLKTNYRAGEKILAAMMNSTNKLTNDNSEAVESLKNSLLEAALNGGTVNAASNIILSSVTGLNASNVQDALAELTSNLSATDKIYDIVSVLNSNAVKVESKLNSLIESYKKLISIIVFHSGTPFNIPTELQQNVVLDKIVISTGDNTSICGQAICGQAICGN